MDLKKNETMKKYLIVGLGNIGAKYKNTRHNIGFKILDKIAENENVIFETKNLVILRDSNIKAEPLFC